MIDIIRGCTRPAVTIIFAAVIARVITEQIPISPQAWTLLIGVILWWFGGREVGHIKGKKDGK